MIDRAKKNAERLKGFGDGSGPQAGPANAIAPSTTASNAPQADSETSNAVDSKPPALPANETQVPDAPETRDVRTEKKAVRKRVITPLGEHHRASKSLVDSGAEIIGLLSVLNRPEDLVEIESRLTTAISKFQEIVMRFGKLPELKPEDKSQIGADYGEAVRLLETRLNEERKRILTLPDVAKGIGPELDALSDLISKLKDRHF